MILQVVSVTYETQNSDMLTDKRCCAGSFHVDASRVGRLSSGRRTHPVRNGVQPVKAASTQPVSPRHGRHTPVPAGSTCSTFTYTLPCSLQQRRA